MRAGAPRRNEKREPTVPKTYKLRLSLSLAITEIAQERRADQADIVREVLERDPEVSARAKEIEKRLSKAKVAV